MNFYPRKNRQAPSIIIISLIDVLIVMVVFLLVTTTYRQQPSLKLTLPESSQGRAADLKPGVRTDRVYVTVHQSVPNYYVGSRPVTAERLGTALEEAVKANPDVSIEVNADKDAGVGLVVRVMDAAKVAGVKKLQLATQRPSGRN